MSLEREGDMNMGKAKVIALVSGGIDSPVACALAGESFEVVPVHFCLYPYTCEETFQVAINTLKNLKEIVKFEKLIVFPWARVLDRIQKDKRNLSHACLACRKGMFKVADRICEQEGATGIITGESLGQKASQTLMNLNATTRGIKFPILKPLLGMDKIEIERISKEIGTWYEVHAGCCYATPKHPRTRTKPEILDAIIETLQLEDIIDESFKKVLEVKTFEEDFENYLNSLA